MKSWKRTTLWTGIVTLALVLCAFPAWAQEDSCCGTCGGDKKACTAEKSCCGTCGGDKDACTAKNKPSCCPQDAAKSAECTQASMEEWMNCAICKPIFDDPELMMACDYSINDWSNGVVMSINLRNTDLMDRMRMFEAHDKKLCAKFKTMPYEKASQKICSHCNAYLEFVRNGAREERVETPTGRVILLHADNPQQLKKLHAFGAKSREMMASFDPSMLPGFESTAPCASTCSESCSSTCSSECPSSSATANIPPEMMQEFMNCELCKMYMQNPEMMTVAKCDVIYLNNGMALLSTVNDPAKVKAYQAFEKKFQNKIDEYRKMPDDAMKGKFCSICKKFHALEVAGASMDWADTPTGTMTVITGNNDQLVAKIKSLGKTLEQMIPN